MDRIQTALLMAVTAFVTLATSQLLDIRVSGASGGDWLTFLGALAGVVIAIAGGQIIDANKVKAQQRRAIVRLREAIAKVAFAVTYPGHDAAGTPDDNLLRLTYRHGTTQRAIHAYRYALSHVTIDDMDLWEGLTVFGDNLDFALRVIENSKPRIYQEALDPQAIVAIDVRP